MSYPLLLPPVAVSGPVNLETSVPVGPFPLTAPLRRNVDGIEAHVSGIAYNVAAGLAALGTPVRLTAITGNDEVGALIKQHVAAIPAIEARYVELGQSPLTVVLHGLEGEEAVFSDLRDAPATELGGALELDGCSAFVPVPIPANFPALEGAARAGLPVLVDLQTVSALDEPGKEPFCPAAHALAMSAVHLDAEPEVWLREMGERYGTPIMILGLGERGALLARDAGRRIDHVPAAAVPVASTVGAGDALWACFVDGYLRGADPLWALQRAVAGAGHKLATVGAGRGFATAALLRDAGWGEPGVALREVDDGDVPIFYRHSIDPDAIRMAAVPTQRTQQGFLEHWAKILANPTGGARTITLDGRVAGHIISWESEGRRELGYWIDKDLWGRGIATAALTRFLDLVPDRPLYAHVAAHNEASLRVLQKCGFEITGRTIAEDGIEEVAVILGQDRGRSGSEPSEPRER